MLKSVVCFVLVTSSVLLSTSNAYADAYVRRAAGNDWDWSRYTSEDRPLPPLFGKLNDTFFNQALYMESSGESDYVVLPGEYKRQGVLKLQKSGDGTKGGARAALVLPSKAAAGAFCGRLIHAAHNHDDENPLPAWYTVFASDLGGDVRETIAVAYAVTNKLVAGKDWYWKQSTNNRKLTSAKKYALCPNPWGMEQDPAIDDENELIGVRASGLANFGWLSPDSEKDDLYHVICNNPDRAENEFFWYPPAYSSSSCGNKGKWATLSDPSYVMCDRQYDSLKESDAVLGAAYCSGELKPVL